MYIKLTNGVPTPYTIGQLRKDNPNTSFPKKVPDEMLAEYGVIPYTIADQPVYDEATQKIEEGDIAEVGGVWTKGWNVVAKSQDEVDQYVLGKKAEFEAAVQNLLDTEARSKGYDNILSMISYGTSTKPQWKAEAVAAVKWRDDCWNEALVQLGNYIATGVEPTMEDFLAAMPAINWPQV